MSQDETPTPIETQDMKLPGINPLLKLYKAAPAQDGSPRWILYYPTSNKNYQIGWAEFECLARFHKCKTVSELVEAVNSETTLTIDDTDVKALLIFLSNSGLLKVAEQIAPPQAPNSVDKPLWKTMIHSYLFFSIPLLKPEKLLNALYPIVRPLFSKTFFSICLLLLGFGIMLTLKDPEPFFHTFTQFFSLEGILMITITFTIIKVFHEFGHALMARHFGVSVPHMGVAFMVLYPVLYTEMTGSWRVTSRKARILMGMAGVMTELALAAIFLIYYHLTPSAVGQSVAFSVVAISMLGSLLVNLNPFMRFDGYYVLSDYLGIENLHQKAFAYARHWIRRKIFGLKEEKPDHFDTKTERFLTIFGIGMLIYRFILYLGIAFLVYYVFFKPLGLILFLVEIAWFIALPILKEIKYLWEQREKLRQASLMEVRLLVFGVIILLFILPSHNTVQTMAIAHPSLYQNVYAPNPALIEKINVQEGKTVEKGDVLAELSSPELDKDISIAQAKLQGLTQTKRREQTNIRIYRDRRGMIDQDIQEAMQALESLKEKRNRLTITADFAGVIRDVDPDIHKGRSITQSELLFRIINNTQSTRYTAYIEENDINRISKGDKAIFSKAYNLFAHDTLIVDAIEPVSIEDIPWEELSAQNGGPLATTKDGNEIKLLKSFYKVDFKAEKPSFFNPPDMIVRGRIKIYGERVSPLWNNLKRFFALIIREIGLN